MLLAEKTRILSATIDALDFEVGALQEWGDTDVKPTLTALRDSHITMETAQAADMKLQIHEMSTLEDRLSGCLVTDFGEARLRICRSEVIADAIACKQSDALYQAVQQGRRADSTSSLLINTLGDKCGRCTPHTGDSTGSDGQARKNTRAAEPPVFEPILTVVTIEDFNKDDLPFYCPVCMENVVTLREAYGESRECRSHVGMQ